MYSTDWHYTGRNPSTRTDDFSSTMDAKISNWFEMGHDLGADFFLHGGDFFDSPHTSESVVIHVGKMMEQKAKKKKIYGVVGNHDVMSWNPKTISKTPFGVFQAFSPCFTLLNREPLLHKNSKGKEVKLTGVSSYAQLDRHIIDKETGDILQHRNRDYVIEEFDGTPHVHVVHGYLSPKAILDEIAHTVIDEMRHTKATVTLTGHEHTGFPVTKLDHGLGYNPGALARVFASHTEMNRMPKYAFVTIYDDGTPEIEVIQCPIAKIGTEVMNRDDLDLKKAKEAILAEARGSIREVLKGMDIQGIDLRAIMKSYKEETKPEVWEEANKRLKLQ